jgi:glycosyltransferase involved in cell wall biosynthesis
MNIVITTDQVSIHGGIEKVTITKVNYWAKDPNMRIYILTSDQTNKPSQYPLDSRVEIIDLGINYDRSKSNFSWKNIKKGFSHFKKQKKILKKIKPDFIIHPNLNLDYLWLPYIKQNAKLIKEIHSSGHFKEQKRKTGSIGEKLKLRLDDWIISKYDQIVVLNEDEKKYLNLENVVVIPNPVSKNNQKANLSKKQVIAAGRIAPIKGFNHLIKAWAAVHTDFPEWNLHIYGQEFLNTQSKLQKQIEDLDLQKSIIFMGNVDNLPEAMTNYSIYAMTSVTECFPMVLLEALSIGLPIVSYDCPNGPRNIIKNKIDGYLVPNQNNDEFANQLKTLMKDEKLRSEMGKNGIENVKRFELEKVMKLWKNKIFDKE